jgi:hypothetical protein
MAHHIDHHQIEGMAGAAAELLKQGGYMRGQLGTSLHRGLTGTHMGHSSAHTVQSLARYAPGAILALGVTAPYLLVLGGLLYGGHAIFKRLNG